MYLAKSKYLLVKNKKVFSSYIPAALCFNVKLMCRCNPVCSFPLLFLEDVLMDLDLCISDIPELASSYISLEERFASILC